MSGVFYIHGDYNINKSAVENIRALNRHEINAQVVYANSEME